MRGRRLRVAVAGGGMVARHHLAAWSALAGAEVVGIADVAPERARTLAENFAVPRWFADAGDMLDALRPDALDVAVSPAAHGDVVRAAARRGIDVLCQKPLMPTLAEAEALVADCVGRIRLMVHENWRFRPVWRAVRDWVAAGEIGRPRLFRLSVEGGGLVPPSAGGPLPSLVRQPFLAEIERLVVWELLIHHFDALASVLGPLELRAAALHRLSPTVRGEDSAALMLATAAGASGTVTGSFHVPGAPVSPIDRLLLLGDAGSVEIDGAIALLRGRRDDRVAGSPEAAYQAAYDGAISHFADCLRSGAAFETGPATHLSALRLAEDCYATAGASRAAGAGMPCP